jgi:hypothetical protein
MTTISRRTLIGGLAAIPATACPGRALSAPEISESLPASSRVSGGSCVNRIGDAYYLQTWDDRDDIAHGFRFGTVRQFA